MYTKSRAEEVAFMKRLWQYEETMCPKCGGAVLTHLHKKVKKSDNDWVCPACGGDVSHDQYAVCAARK